MDRFVAARHPGAARSNHEWSERARHSWHCLLEAADEALATDMTPHALSRTRITLEVELERAQRQQGPAPAAIDDAYRALIAKLRERMRAFRPAPTELKWPVRPVIITSRFGYRRDPIRRHAPRRFHAGVDLAGDSGTLVHAAGPGTVIFSGWRGAHGRVVHVRHNGGLVSVYAHLKLSLVSAGAEVDANSVIGLMGNTGRSTGPHLHFEIRADGRRVNPEKLVRKRSDRRPMPELTSTPVPGTASRLALQDRPPAGPPDER